jgi:hypothetical protein
VGNPTTLVSFTPLAGPVLIGTPVKMTISFTGSDSSSGKSITDQPRSRHRLI